MNPVDAWRASQQAEAANANKSGYYLVGAAREKRTYRPGRTVPNGSGQVPENIRILASEARIAAGKNPFYDVVFLHIMPKPMGFRGDQEIYCPKKNDGGACELCDKAEALVRQAHDRRDALKKEYGEAAAKADGESTQMYKDANKFEARRHFAIDMVQRDRSADGRKMWFIKEDRFKKQGAMDKIAPQVKQMMDQGEDFSHPQTGFDLILQVDDIQNPTGTGTYRGVTSAAFARHASPLAPTQEEIARIEADSLEWRQLKKPLEVRGWLTPEQFIHETAMGRMPVWDDKFVTGGQYNGAWLVTPPNGQPFHAEYKNSPEAQAKAQNPGTVPNMGVTQVGAPAGPAQPFGQPATQGYAQPQQTGGYAPQPAAQPYQQPAPTAYQQPAAQPYQQQPAAPAPVYAPQPAAQPAPTGPTGGQFSYKSQDDDDLPF